jgi:uncharacterized membrane protein YphA (DoxX/SURF4 family)
MNKEKMISRLQTAFRWILAAALILAGVLKVYDNTSLFETVAYIWWLPVWMKSLVVDALPWIEILIGVLLVAKWQPKVITSVVFLIFLGFFAFAVYGTATGMEGDCGCFGGLVDSSFGWQLITRNAIFTAMAGFLVWNHFKKPEVNREVQR